MWELFFGRFSVGRFGRSFGGFSVGFSVGFFGEFMLDFFLEFFGDLFFLLFDGVLEFSDFSIALSMEAIHGFDEKEKDPSDD